MQINDIIARANVIDVTKIENDGKVIFGSTVTVKDIENEKKKSFKIVGKDEADIGKSLIYFKSPMGKSLIGKTIKDLVTVNTPSGEKNFEILEVEIDNAIYQKDEGHFSWYESEKSNRILQYQKNTYENYLSQIRQDLSQLMGE